MTVGTNKMRLLKMFHKCALKKYLKKSPIEKHWIQHLVAVVWLVVLIGGGCLRIPLKVPAYSAATIRLSHWEGSEHEIALHPAPSPLPRDTSLTNQWDKYRKKYKHKYGFKYKYRCKQQLQDWAIGRENVASQRLANRRNIQILGIKTNTKTDTKTDVQRQIETDKDVLRDNFIYILNI